MIPCDLDLTSTPFCYTTVITYKIELPPSGQKFDFYLLYDEDFTIPYITDTIPNSPDGHQLLKQAKLNRWIIDINGEEHITCQGALDELNRYQKPMWRIQGQYYSIHKEELSENRYLRDSLQI